MVFECQGASYSYPWSINQNNPNMIKPSGQQHQVQHGMLLALLGSFALHAAMMNSWPLTINEPITTKGSETHTLRFEVIKAAVSPDQKAAQRPHTSQGGSPTHKEFSVPAYPLPIPAPNNKSHIRPVEPIAVQKINKQPRRKPKTFHEKSSKPNNQARKQKQVPKVAKSTVFKQQVTKSEIQPLPISAKPIVQKQSDSKARFQSTPKTQITSTQPSSDEEQSFATSETSKPETANRITLLLEEQLRKHFRYPGLARRRGLEGTVLLQFTLQMDGNISDIQVLHSSGHGILDRNAQATLKRIGHVQLGQSLLLSQTQQLTLPVTYRLEKG